MNKGNVELQNEEERSKFTKYYNEKQTNEITREEDGNIKQTLHEMKTKYENDCLKYETNKTPDRRENP